MGRSGLLSRAGCPGRLGIPESMADLAGVIAVAETTVCLQARGR